jgi:hypothetical protein
MHPALMMVFDVVVVVVAVLSVHCLHEGLDDVCGETLPQEKDLAGSYGNYFRNSTPPGKKMYNFTCDIVNKVPGGLDDKWIRKCPPGTKSCFYAQGNYDSQSKFFGGSTTTCASPPPRSYIFSNYSFWVHHPVNCDDQHLLAHAMASDFTVAWQYSQREQFFVTGQTPRPYLTKPK